MEKYKVEITGMSCMHCVGHVKNAFQECGKVENLDVKIGEAIIEGSLTEEEIKEIIEDEGYDVVKIERM